MLLNAVLQVCDDHLMEFSTGSNFTNSNDLLNILSDIMPTFDQTFKKCKWRNVLTECSELFHTFVTDDGPCFTFNTLSAFEIYRDEG